VRELRWLYTETKHMTCHLFTLICWGIVWSYWLYSAWGTKRNQASRQGILLRVCIRMGSMVSFVLVFYPHLSVAGLGMRWLPENSPLACFGALLCALGLAFAIWARHTLGTNWSGEVTLKEDHQLMQTGPYAVVRHPLYAGFLLSMCGTALALGEVRGVLAFALMSATFAKKTYDEEQLMMFQFPGEYPSYKARVARVIPFLF